MKPSDLFLSLVLPARNQADHIAALLRRHRETLERWSDAGGGRFEIVVVPNACSDDTPGIVHGLAGEDDRIVCRDIPLPGWGRAVRTGLAASRGTALCYTNSARTDPAQVPALVEVFLVSGGRFAKVRRMHRGAPVREIGSALFNLEARLLYGCREGDVNGTPKILSRDLYEALALASDGDLLDLELMAKLKRLRIPAAEMPVEGFGRHGGRSSTTLRSAIRIYAGAWQLRGMIRGFEPGPAVGGREVRG